MKRKIVTLEELSKISEEYKKNGKSIVHCHGSYDVLHTGHIHHFKAAKTQGDILVVTLTADRYIDTCSIRRCRLYNSYRRSNRIACNRGNKTFSLC